MNRKELSNGSRLVQLIGSSLTSSPRVPREFNWLRERQAPIELERTTETTNAKRLVNPGKRSD